MLQHNSVLGVALWQVLTNVRFPALKFNDLNEYGENHRYETACAKNDTTREAILSEGNVLVLWTA